MRRLTVIFCCLALSASGDVEIGHSLADDYELIYVAPFGYALNWITGAEPSTLALEWLFDTDANPTTDTSGNGNDGTVSGSEWTTNAVGPRFWYYQDAIDDTIITTASQDKVTIELWATANSGNHWSHYVKAGSAEYVDGVAQAWTEANYYDITGDVVTLELQTAGNVDTFRVHSVSNDAATVYEGYTNDLISVMGLATAADLASDAALIMHFDYPKGAGIGHDSSTNLNHGTYNGSEGQYTWFTNGAWHGAAAFDGVDDYLDITGVSDATTEMTFAMWINPGDVSGQQTLLNNARQYLMRLNGANLQFSIPFVAAATASTGTVSADEWAHVAIVWDRDGNTIDYYINGSHDSQVAFSSEPSITGNAAIGALGGGGIWYNGNIDEPLIYTSALSGTTISNTLFEAVKVNYGH